MKKLLSCLLFVCMLAAIAAGCGSPAQSPSSKDSSNDSTSAGEEVTLTFVRTGTPEVLHDIFDDIIKQFETDYPNIKIDMQDLGWSDAEKSIQAWAASETLPDVMYHLPGTIFDMADKGLIMDLTPYLENSALKDDMYPSMLEAGRYKDKQYVIPCGASTLMLWYNTEVFEKAGLDPETPPSTFDELLSAAKTITEKAGVPGMGTYAKPSGGETSFVFESLYDAASGASAWDAQNQKYTYDDPANKEAALSALTLMQNLVDYSQPSVAEYGRFDVRTLLRDGNVGMVLDLINMYNVCTEQIEDGTVKVAQIPAGASGKPLSAVNMGGWFIPQNCEHPEEAWTFLSYLMQAENQAKHATYGSVPILKSEAETYSGEYWETVIQSVEDSTPEGICVETNELWNDTGEQLQALLMRTQTPEQTLENITQKHEAVYNER